MESSSRFLTDDDILNHFDGNLSDIDIPGMSSDDEGCDETFVPPVISTRLGESSDESNTSDSEEENTELPVVASAEASSSATSEPVLRRPVRKQKTRRMIWRKEAFSEKPWPGPLDLETIENPDPPRSPLSYFTDYFSNEFFESTSCYTNMYSLTKGKELKTNPEELKRFFGVNLYMGVIHYPRIKMYWRTNVRLSVVADNMSRDRFISLRNNIHVVDVNRPPGDSSSNKFWKIQPVIDAVRSACIKLPRNYKTYSIDEQMIPFTGHCPSRQLVKNKPRPVGLKNLIVTTSGGLVLDFEIYQGPSTPLPNPELGLGASIVLRLAQTIPPKSFLFFDRYFTSINLLEKLSEMDIEGTGTFIVSRGKDIPFQKNVKFQRGDSCEYVRADGKIVAVEWMDSNKVYMLSTHTGIEPQEKISRWSKSDKKYVDVMSPAAVRRYNQCMGGVDVCDQQMECYRTWFKTKKWTVKCIFHFLDLAVVNSWMLYIMDCKANKIPKNKRSDLLQFRLDLAEALVSTPERSRAVLSSSESEEEERAPKRSKYYNPPAILPGVDKRYDGYDHLPVFDDIKAPRSCRLEGCNSRSKILCEKCKVYLCLARGKACFKLFHKK